MKNCPEDSHPDSSGAVMEEIADLDQRIKTGLITDHLAVEVFIVKHAKK